MEIHALRAVFREQELTTLAVQAAEDDPRIQELTVRLSPEGISIQGVYQFVVGMPFETVWEVGVHEGRLVARLGTVRVARLGVSMFRGMLLGALADAAKKVEGLALHQDMLLLDLDRLLAAKGFPSRTNLRRVQCGPGTLLIEASSDG